MGFQEYMGLRKRGLDRFLLRRIRCCFYILAVLVVLFRKKCFLVEMS